MKRRSFLALASGLLVPAMPDVRRVYSFVRKPGPRQVRAVFHSDSRGVSVIELGSGRLIQEERWPHMRAIHQSPDPLFTAAESMVIREVEYRPPLVSTTIKGLQWRIAP